MSTTDADLPAPFAYYCPKTGKFMSVADYSAGAHLAGPMRGNYEPVIFQEAARAAIEADRARAAGELEKLRADAAALDWIECRAMNGQIQIARSIMGKGYEIATLERNGGPVIITVELGTLRKAIAARTGSTPTTKEQGS